MRENQSGGDETAPRATFFWLTTNRPTSCPWKPS